MSALPASGRRAQAAGGLALATIAPLGPTAAAGPAAAGILRELASALGIAALSLLGVVLVLPSRARPVSRLLGAEVAVRLHRRLARAVVGLIVAHVAVAVLAQTARLRLLDPVGAPWRAQAALASVVALATMIATSVARARLRLLHSLHDQGP